ncbi:MAG: capsular polysaccharide biosynthesis protein [Hydrogenimonas sp.]|nr:MAG: capsular polysaccharide biosynthesis protein [Hydrogenimonas sp.]
MKHYSTSKRLIKNAQNFFDLEYYTRFDEYLQRDGIFYGWGRKTSGQRAIYLAKKFNTSYRLLEDGFIRSIGLGVTGAPSFSIVEDDLGVYYDATKPSRLENILKNYDFQSDKELLEIAKQAIDLIRTYKISKYNQSSLKPLNDLKNDLKKVLIIAQTEGDLSLKYGMADKFDPKEMVITAIEENRDAEIYLKVHPDVLTGKKASNIDINFAKKYCRVITEDIHPIVLLEAFDKVYTQTSQMGFEAVLLGKEVICFGMPFYAGWGVTVDKIKSQRRGRKLSKEEIFAGAYILYTKYYNPFSQKPSNIIDTIETIHKYRTIYQHNEGDLYFFGFSWWKKQFLKDYFPALQHNQKTFCSTINHALKKGLNQHSKIFIWGKREFLDVEAYAKEHKIPIYRVEDGFIRSVSLGSDLTRAYSLVVDSQGIYFDPTQPSDLEEILNSYTFDQELLQRAKALQNYITTNKISKYNIYKDVALDLKGYQEGQKIIMVPGQVEDDASIIYGADGMSNLELLQAARKNAPDAYIIYKPHPDVLAGNRKGNIDDVEALKYCNLIVKEASIDSVLEVADEVHTMTSLVGFEALLRGKKVYTYGMPFYAGWGLTIDAKTNPRREKRRSLEELIAATLILYPRYIHPKTKTLCEIEALLEAIDQEKKRYNNNFLYRLMVDSRNFISRKIQWILKVLLGG